MYVITDNKYCALDIKAHEEMYGDTTELYHNPTENKWAVKVLSDHGVPAVTELGEGWICKS